MCQGERTETNDCFLRLCGVREGESKRERERGRDRSYMRAEEKDSNVDPHSR